MTDRNWERELAKIDKQLASVSDEELLAQTKVERAAPGAAPAGKPVAPAAKLALPSGPTKTVGSWFAWAQLAVAIGAATGLWFWPWGTRCGLNSVAFVAATGGVTLLGLWSAVGSWRHRQGKAHILSFAVMIWGLVLGAREVLPRVGYALPSGDHPAGWSCTAPVTPPAANPTPDKTPNSPPTTPPSATPEATQPPTSKS